MGRHYLWVFFIHRRGDHQDITVSDILCRVSLVDMDTQGRQSLGHGIVAQVRTTDLITQVVQHLGNTTHAGAADANQVDMFDPAHRRVSHCTPPDKGRRLV